MKNVNYLMIITTHLLLFIQSSNVNAEILTLKCEGYEGTLEKELVVPTDTAGNSEGTGDIKKFSSAWSVKKSVKNFIVDTSDQTLTVVEDGVQMELDIFNEKSIMSIEFRRYPPVRVTHRDDNKEYVYIHLINIHFNRKTGQVAYDIGYVEPNISYYTDPSIVFKANCEKTKLPVVQNKF